MKIVYLCDGHAGCVYEPMCVYREEPVSATDFVCKHTFDPSYAKNGACEDPKNHPERFHEMVMPDTGEEWYVEVVK